MRVHRVRQARVTCRIMFILLCNVGLLVPCARPQELPVELFQHWIHSYEEDEAGIRVFRPAGYSFPPARGRDGFEIRATGEFILRSPGPTDRTQSTRGTWIRDGPSHIRVFLPNEEQGREIRIVEVTTDILRITYERAEKR